MRLAIMILALSMVCTVTRAQTTSRSPARPATTPAAATTMPAGGALATSSSVPATDPLNVEKLELSAREKAQNWMDALLADRFDVFAAGMYPKVVEKMGGREKVVAALTAGRAKAKTQGIAITLATAGECKQVVTANGKSYAIVPESLEITTPKGVGQQGSFLLGVSNDGKDWTFIDGATGDAQIRQMLPDLPTDFKLPTIPKPQAIKQK